MRMLENGSKGIQKQARLGGKGDPQGTMHVTKISQYWQKEYVQTKKRSFERKQII